MVFIATKTVLLPKKLVSFERETVQLAKEMVSRAKKVLISCLNAGFNKLDQQSSLLNLKLKQDIGYGRTRELLKLSTYLLPCPPLQVPFQ